MVLDEVFRNEIRRGINGFLDGLTESVYDTRQQRIWGYTNAREFHYGKIVGKLEGIAIGIWWERNQRPLDAEEGDEIREIVEENVNRVREIVEEAIE